MVNTTEAVSLILVGAFWGCTNPFMRKGSVKQNNDEKHVADRDCPHNDKQSEGYENKINKEDSNAFVSLSRLARIQVWLPYLVNQLGSLLYYKLLGSSNLTLSVPICNATAMVFSSITSFILGERVNQPGKATLGVVLVLSGVAICMYSTEEGSLGPGEIEGRIQSNGEL